MATCIHTLLQARFGTKAVDTWFLTEAKEIAQSVTWNSDTQRIDSLPSEAQSALNAPLYGSQVEHQSWEILDDFDAPADDILTGDHQVTFELANHFSLEPAVDHASLRDTGSLPSFTTGMTDATKNVAAAAEADARAASGGDSTTSTLTNSTAATATSHRGGNTRSPSAGTAPSSPSAILPQSSDAVRQTQSGEGDG